MSLTRLTRDEMLALTAPWLDTARPSTLLPLVPGWADLRSVVAAAVDELMLLPADDSPAAALAVRLALLDRRHDRKVRVVDRILSGHAENAENADERARYLRLAELVLPGGVGANTLIAWSEEAGRALVRARVLTDEVRAQLRAIPVAGGTLETVVDEIQRAATEIGAGLAERDAMGQPLVTPERMRAARLRWARVARHVLEAVALAPRLTATNRDALLGPFERAEKAARARARANGEDEDDDPIVVPTPAPAPAS